MAELKSEFKSSLDHLREATVMGVLMCLSFFLVTINYRAVAQANYPVTLLTDVAICTLNWSLFKRIAEATHWYNRVGYIAGGGAGSLIAIWLTLYWFGK